MKTISILLASATLLYISVSAAAQTAPKPKVKTTTSSQPRTTKKVPSKNLAVIRDTATFLRSSQPNDGRIRVPIL